MLSDIDPREMGDVQHQQVINLFENKKGQWECVRGYTNVVTGLTNIKSSVEVTEDQTSERFLLIQDGQTLKRVNYNNGYLGETIDTLTLPSGVTIGASAKLRFFYFRGVVRITGASSPLWYGYISRTLFPDADSSGSKVIAEWVLQKAELQKYAIHETKFGEHKLGSTGASYFLRSSYVYDGSQYALMEDGVTSTSFPQTLSDIEIVSYASATGGWMFLDILIPDSVSGVNMNKRLTGVLVMIGSNSYGVFDEATNVWRVGEFLDFSDNLGKVNYRHSIGDHPLRYDGVNDNRLQFIHGSHSENMAQDGYIMEGMTVTIKNSNGSVIDATVNNVNENPSSGRIEWFEIDSDVSNLLTTGLGTAEEINASMQLTRFWDYTPGTGYTTRIIVDLLTGNTFADFTSIPAGTKHNTPDYTHYAVIEDIAYCASNETEEEDSIRYSPINQFDNFPIGNLIQTETGSIDAIKAIAKRSNRLMIFKGASISQGNFVSSQYYEDIGISENGLFSLDGYVMQGAIAYFIDKDDVYIFDGSEPRALLRGQGMRSIYRDNVNSSSFLAYNMLDNELLVLVGSKILSYRFDKQSWSERSADVSFIHAFRDSDRRLLLCSSTKIVTYNHSLSSFSEAITWSFLSRILSDDRTEYLSKLNKINSLLSASGDVTIGYDDTDNSTARSNSDITPDTTYLINKRVNPRFFFKSLDVQVSSKNSSTSQACKIKEVDLEIEVWNK